MNEHPEAQLAFYVAGTLAADEMVRIEAHVRVCAACQQVVREWEKIAPVVRQRAGQTALSLPPLATFLSHDVKEEDKNMAVQVLPRRYDLTQLAATLVMVLLGAFLLLMGDRPQTPRQEEAKTVYDLVQEDPRFSQFTATVDQYPYIREVLDGNDPVTLFVMSNEVFQPVLDGMVGYEEAEPDPMEFLLWSHMGTGEWSIAQLAETNQVIAEWSWGGGYSIRQSINVYRPPNGDILLNRLARIVETNDKAINGVVYVIDVPLFTPQTIAGSLVAAPAPLLLDALKADPRLSLFLEAASEWAMALLEYDLTVTTVFAPTNEAFEAVLAQNPSPEELERIVFMHLLGGLWTQERLAETGSIPIEWKRNETVYTSRLTARWGAEGLILENQALVIEGDRILPNGILHIIDATLIEQPPSTTATE